MCSKIGEMRMEQEDLVRQMQRALAHIHMNRAGQAIEILNEALMRHALSK